MSFLSCPSCRFPEDLREIGGELVEQWWNEGYLVIMLPLLVCVAISSIALRMLTVDPRGFQHFFFDIRATKLGNDNCLRALQQEKWNFKAENTL